MTTKTRTFPETAIRNPEYLSITYRRATTDPTRHVDRWYDPRSRNWIIQLKDENDYEVGSDVVGCKSDALWSADVMSRHPADWQRHES